LLPDIMGHVPDFPDFTDFPMVQLPPPAGFPVIIGQPPPLTAVFDTAALWPALVAVGAANANAETSPTTNRTVSRTIQVRFCLIFIYRYPP
jgi:hypothetical protein